MASDPAQTFFRAPTNVSDAQDAAAFAWSLRQKPFEYQRPLQARLGAPLNSELQATIRFTSCTH